MNKSVVILAALIVLGITACKKDPASSGWKRETISMGSNSASDVYFSLANGTAKTINRSDWDIAFSTPTQSAIVLINELLDAGAKVKACDPEAIGEARKIFGDRIEYLDNMYDTLEQACALILVTEWPKYQNPDFDKIKGLMKEPVIFDGRNIYSTRTMRMYGFKYFPVGRQPVL